MSLRPSPKASTSAARDAETGRHLGQRGGLVHPRRGDVQPGAPADEVGHPVQAQVPGQPDEVLVGPGRVAQDDAGHRPRAQLLDVLDDHLAGQVAAGEVVVEPVAAADLLHRDQRSGRELLHPLDHLARVEGHRLDDLLRRVADDHRAVGADRRPGRQPQLARPAAACRARTARWPAPPAPRPPAPGRSPHPRRWAAGRRGRPGCRRRRRRPAGAASHCSDPISAASAPRGRPGTGGAPRVRVRSRRPAGGSPAA